MNFKILEAGGLELPNYKRYISLNIVYNVLGLSKVSEIRRTWPNVEQSKIQANVQMAVALQQQLTKWPVLVELPLILPAPIIILMAKRKVGIYVQIYDTVLGQTI